MLRILLVDDEQNILNALRRCLSRIDARQLDGEALQFESFTSPEAAIERSEEQDFDLVVSDYRMPTMDGVQFLTRMIECQPAVPRMIISGFADRGAIIAAVNEVQLVRFIEKPWNDDELRQAVVSILRGKGPGLEKVLGDDPTVERDENGGITIGQFDQEGVAD